MSNLNEILEMNDNNSAARYNKYNELYKYLESNHVSVQEFSIFPDRAAEQRTLLAQMITATQGVGGVGMGEVEEGEIQEGKDEEEEYRPTTPDYDPDNPPQQPPQQQQQYQDINMEEQQDQPVPTSTDIATRNLSSTRQGCRFK